MGIEEAIRHYGIADEDLVSIDDIHAVINQRETSIRERKRLRTLKGPNLPHMLKLIKGGRFSKAQCQKKM